MKKKITVIYWKSEKWWLGKIFEHPEIMSQGETQEELFENLKMHISLCFLMRFLMIIKCRK
jgi:predicted RNase H-like HicB family nuclease